MPSAFIKKISEERDISMRALEDIFEKAKTMAGKKFDEDDPQFYPHVTNVFKNMLGMSSNLQVVAFAKTVPSKIESVSECFMVD
jgi:hypothetical protein